MTEAPLSGTAATNARRRPGPMPMALAAIACFLVIFELLAFRLSSGQDPALGAAPARSRAAAISKPAKRIVITKVLPASRSAPAGSTTSTAAAPVSAPAPVVSSSS